MDGKYAIDKSKLICVEKPGDLSFSEVRKVLDEAHRGNPKVEYTTSNLTEDEVKDQLAEGGCVFVAFYQNEPVDTMTIGIETKAYKKWYLKGKTAVLIYLAVLPKYAGNGMASSLVNACVDWAAKNNRNTILWDTAFNNDEDCRYCGEESFSKSIPHEIAQYKSSYY